MSKQIILGITPARGGSKGIPRKNLAVVGGKPLVAHTIAHAQKSLMITDHVVTSEDQEIQNVAQSFGAEVIKRPPEMASDTARVDPLLIETVREWERVHERQVDIIVLLYPTAPLRSISALDKAVRLVAEESYDSALSLYEDGRYLWKKNGDVVAPVNYEPSLRMPRQKEEWNQWAENKAVYVMTRALLFDTGCRLGGRIGCVEMEGWRSIDVDKPEDLMLVRELYDYMIEEGLGDR